MKYLMQFLVILLFSFVGEILHALIPLPIPASIYGLVLLFAALLSGVLKVEQVKDAADFLIEIMAILFIPAGVGVMASWDVLQPVIIPVVVILIVSTILVMIVSGHVTQAVIRLSRKRQKKSANKK